MPATSLLRTILVVAAGFSCVLAADITLVTFDNSPATTKSFRQTDDPVMGGKSTGTWTVDTANEVGVFDGNVVNVPSLKAPGFIKAQSANSVFPDISSCSGIALKARSATAYSGYRFSFSNKKGLFCSFFSGGFKTHFAAPTGSAFQDVVIPFASFSDCNSDSTGEPKKLCKDDKSVCPDQKTLKDIETVSIWAEGAAGEVHLEIKSISATGCKGDAAAESSGLSSAPVSVLVTKDQFCLHAEQVTDHKCTEACAESTFAQVGVTEAGPCPAAYNTVDHSEVDLQCPDGVTNLRYCPDTAMNVTVEIKGEEEGDNMLQMVANMAMRSYAVVKSFTTLFAADEADYAIYHLDSGNHCYQTSYTDKHYQSLGYEDGPCPVTNTLLKTTTSSVCEGHSDINEKYCPTQMVSIGVYDMGIASVE